MAAVNFSSAFMSMKTVSATLAGKVFPTAFLCIVLLGAGCRTAQVTRESGVIGSGDSVVVRSPNGVLAVSVGVASDGRLTYSIHALGKEVLPPSPLGLTVDDVDLGKGAKFAGEPVVREMDETYAVFGNHAQARNHAVEAEIPLETLGKKFTLIVRAYDDGAAVRYGLPDGAKKIGGEATAWSLPAGARKIAWMEFSQCYEGLSHVTLPAGVPEDKPVMGPLTIQMADYYLAISESDNESFSDLAFVRQGTQLVANFPFSTNGWTLQRRADEARPGVVDGTYRGRPASPWRTTVVVRDLTGLVNSDLLTSLCPPPADGADFSWVKPGRCLWQWWSVGAPRYEDQHNWYDAAAKLKWEYYLIDDGWRVWKQPGRNQWELLKEVIAYGHSVGVRTLAWAHSEEMRDAKGRRAYLEKVKACGADGIKIDFHPDPTADYMQWYMGAMQDCAELKLLVNFHGSVKPSGLRRTYPNDITREAVRGDEYQMSRYQRVMPLAQDVSLPFTRPLAGPADITPVMMNPDELKTAGFTWPHEFAQAIVFQSSVTHFADQYKFYLGSPLEDLFRELPVVWDETRVLACTDMGEVVAFARRSGNVWWLGVMNGAREQTVKIPLDFLKARARGTLIYDEPHTDAAVDHREQAVSPSDALTLTLRPAGGFVARFGPVP
jgi:alpha-glucosidase